MTARSVDRAVEGLARQQHGAFHHRQALRIGATPGIIGRRLAAGTWVRLADSSVYALPSHPGTWLRQCMAATLSIPGSGVSGLAGAALHGFPGLPRAGIEIANRQLAGTHRSPFATVRRTTHLGGFVFVDRIPVVAPADCAIQLAAALPPARLGLLVSELDGERRGFLDDLRDRYVAVARSRLPGIGAVRAILDEHGDGDVPLRSELERRLRHLLASVPELPAARWEATPPWGEPGKERVDALIPSLGLIVEADGRRWHTRVADFERDRTRDNLAAVHGHAVLRFTWRAMTRDPSECRQLLVRYLARSASTGAA